MKFKDFYLLMFGRFVAGIGTFFNTIAIELFILLKTKSPTLTGFSIAIKLIAACLASPILGTLADKTNRKIGMLISDGVLIITMLLLAICPEKHVVLMVFLTQAALGVFQNYFMINFQAALPCFAPNNDLIKANSWFQAANCTSVVIGSIGASIFITLIGYRWAFATNALTYLVSFLIILFLNIKTREQDDLTISADINEKNNDGFWSAVSFLIKTSPLIFFLFFVRFLDGVGSGSHNVAMPMLSNILRPDTPNTIFGVILGAWGLGSLISTIILGDTKHFNFLKPAHYKNIFIASTMLMSIFWVITFLNTNVVMLGIFAFITGIFDTTATVTYSTILQLTDDKIRGRVMAISTVSLAAGFGGGIAFAALMAKTFSPLGLVAFWHSFPIFIIFSYMLFATFNYLKRGNNYVKIRNL